eukprot:CAMPEP_0119400488 /NCGR_PEP_ID=MMETSP1334-20130426/141894_1 /TAXON_ID=127549 /ORGANISM="Calcidiscus leptoporus, Strain RCC1130" /LENGTH=76 /DNA_ID=CAMNT_0007424399 /DNA_START=462 /DNA_END=692 /DNA_ORIENTATION=+
MNPPMKGRPPHASVRSLLTRYTSLSKPLKVLQDAPCMLLLPLASGGLESKDARRYREDALPLAESVGAIGGQVRSR